MARIGVAAILFALLADPTAAGAQVRIIRGGNQAQVDRFRQLPSTPSTDRAQTPRPPVDGRSTSTMTIVPRVIETLPFPFAIPIGLGWASFGYIPAWSQMDALPSTTGGGVMVSPSEGLPTGAVQLDVDPRSALVYIDGAYAGVVSDFSGYYQHLDLVAGPHLVAIVAPNYEPLILQVMVSPGRTFTYRGTLVRANGR